MRAAFQNFYRTPVTSCPVWQPVSPPCGYTIAERTKGASSHRGDSQRSGYSWRHTRVCRHACPAPEPHRLLGRRLQLGRIPGLLPFRVARSGSCRARSGPQDFERPCESCLTSCYQGIWLPISKGTCVRTVQQQGCAGLKNGALLREAAAGGFEVFLTSDQNTRVPAKPEESRIVRDSPRSPHKQDRGLVATGPLGHCRAP